jgi:hypothetical protein
MAQARPTDTISASTRASGPGPLEADGYGWGGEAGIGAPGLPGAGSPERASGMLGGGKSATWQGYRRPVPKEVTCALR